MASKSRRKRQSDLYSRLPFVDTRKSGLNWSPPPSDDYGDACDMGRLFAGCFAIYLKENPSSVGSNTLGHIAADIDFKDTATRGYWVGFFTELEHWIHIGVLADLAKSASGQSGED